MDVDEDDDFYAPEEPVVAQNTAERVEDVPPAKESPKMEEDLEEGEEEDEGGAMDEDDDEDSDIDIITERKDGTKAAPPTQSRYSDIRNIPQRSTSNEMTIKPAPAKKEEDFKPTPASMPLGVPSADQAAAAASKSKIDINVNPQYAPAGKRITAVNIDEDLAENEKPWRKPGTDISDYFNYGFDEFTWALYASKQETLRGEFDGDAIAANNKKMMEDFGNMMMMGGMPGGGAGPAQGGMPSMPGMDGMPPEMQAMMQQMMGSGMDPSQMDPSAMSAMFSGMQNQGGNAAGQGGQGQNFGQGFGGNQGQYGYEQQGMGGGNRGGFGGGRGRGGRRQW